MKKKVQKYSNYCHISLDGVLDPNFLVVSCIQYTKVLHNTFYVRRYSYVCTYSYIKRKFITNTVSSYYSVRYYALKIDFLLPYLSKVCLKTSLSYVT